MANDPAQQQLLEEALAPSYGVGAVSHLRTLLLARWLTLRDALEAVGLGDPHSTVGLQEAQSLLDAGVGVVHDDDAGAAIGLRASELLAEVLNASDRHGALDGSGDGAGCDTGRTASAVGSSAPLSARRLPRQELVLALGRVAPSQGFREWASQLLLRGPTALSELALMCGASGRRVGQPEFCEAVALLNGNSDDAADWFARIGSTCHVRRNASASGTLGASASSSTLGGLAGYGGPSPGSPGSPGNPGGSGSFGVFGSFSAGPPTPSVSIAAQDRGASENTLDFHAFARSVLARPRLAGARDAERPLSLEEFAVRLLFVWGDLASAFGWTAQQIMSRSPKSRARSPRTSLRAAVAAEAKRKPSRQVYRLTSEKWLRALRGTTQNLFLSEIDARAEAERLAQTYGQESAERLFTNLGDRLLVAKTVFAVGEVVQLRVSLRDAGFWGLGGPPCLRIERGPCQKRGRLGLRPFIAVLRSGPALQAAAAAAAAGQDDAPQPCAPQPCVPVECVAERIPVDLAGHGTNGSSTGQLAFGRVPGHEEVEELGLEQEHTDDGGGVSALYYVQLFSSDDGEQPIEPLSVAIPIRVFAVEPPPPFGIRVLERAHNEMVFGWSAPHDNGGHGVLTYELCVWEYERGINDKHVTQSEAVAHGQTWACELRVHPLKPGTAYVARVRCSNRTGWSEWSCPSAKLFTGPALPRAPQVPLEAVGADATSVLLRWPPLHGAVSRYVVQPILVERPQAWSSGAVPHGWGAHPAATVPPPLDRVRDRTAVAAKTQDGPLPEALVSGLLPSTMYRFRVRARNVSGWGPWSEVSEAVQTRSGPPLPPGMPEAVSAATDGIQFRWMPSPNDGGARLVDYTLVAEPTSMDAEQVRVSIPAERHSPDTVLTGWVRGLVGNSSYVVIVVAQNALGRSAPSPPSAPAMTSPLVPEPPSELHILSVDLHSVTLRWTPGCSDGGEPVRRYRVQAQPPAPLKACEVFVTSTEATLCSLHAETEYSFVVQAENAVGLSIPSGRLLAVTRPGEQFIVQDPSTCCSPPVLNGEAQGTALPLRWSPLAACAVEEYEITLASTEEDRMMQCRVSGSESAAVVGNLLPSCGYRVQLRARSKRGWGMASAWSQELRTLALPPFQSLPPRHSESTIHSVALEWDVPDGHPPPVEYEVWWGSAAEVAGRLQQDALGRGVGTNGDPAHVSDIITDSPPPGCGSTQKTTALRAKLAPLQPGTAYVVRMRARNAAGWSPWSDYSQEVQTSDLWSMEEVKQVLLRRYGGTVAIFRVFDRDGDGLLSKQEFFRGFDEAGLEALPLEQRLQLFCHALGVSKLDPASTRSLSYKDFSRCFSKYRAAPSLTRAQSLPHITEGQRHELREDVLRTPQHHSFRRARSPREESIVARLTKPLERGSPRHSARLARTESQCSFRDRTDYLMDSPSSPAPASRLGSPVSVQGM